MPRFSIMATRSARIRASHRRSARSSLSIGRQCGELLVELHDPVQHARGIRSDDYYQAGSLLPGRFQAGDGVALGVRRNLTRLADRVPRSGGLRPAFPPGSNSAWLGRPAGGQNLQDVGNAALHHALQLVYGKLLDSFVGTVQQRPPGTWIAKRHSAEGLC